ncbi:bifunctional phosphopantothenoylcysteine decarboxylase/phosphopantothenate--cysteine ligase CoaBC [Moorella sp. Hama-1]|uniref:bifunctional phosphopantothenoylcysteine decarboxylase/phosphopantothenate--cysteine ligase CoaBC n=1 Tax=Moorella sp. Hama-1 TaxID=2138101 RepID=UPI000D65A7E2|nr:bifunctional phosphopantothenoylcysteine decarboxylase/phosphopantothenate--cysteine ligase CoaBC [Moorella sp. Hama-1]BCV20938.1 peptidase ClpP [Moorella sp. Hama-1]
MRILEGKTIILGISGGIAAYKGAELCRLLVQEGAAVRVIMTRAAREFINPLTFSTLTGFPALTEIFGVDSGGTLTHIDLARAADLFLVAPATANILGKLAAGLADDLLTTTALAVDCPTLVAPAMNVNMFAKAVVQDNLALLQRRGWGIIEPEEGFLACGTTGKGRLASLERIVAACRRALAPRDFQDRTVLVTAGGTREPLDPVRYIGNYSSGKMGYALARAAWERGARVTLISASQLPPPPGVEVVPVERAAEMLACLQEHFAAADVVIMAAAVADFRPARVAGRKIKKEDQQELTVHLKPTEDILTALAQARRNQLLVGFAAETEDLLANAGHKLAAKGLDLIVANNITRPGAGFGSETNIVTIIYPGGQYTELPQLPKLEVAYRILDAITTLPRFQRGESGRKGRNSE